MTALCVVIGVIVGVISTWLIFRTKIRHAVELTKAENAAQLSGLNEKLASREQSLAEAKLSLDEVQAGMTRLREELISETAKRAAAEQKGERIAELEEDLRTTSGKDTAARERITQLEKAVTQLQTTLSEERKQAEESVKFVNEAQQKLSDAFKALSAAALSSNNQSFLDLAKQTLQTYY